MDLVARAAFTFFFIFVVTRVIGRRELSSLEPFDLILLVVIGDLVQQGVTQDDYSVTSIVVVENGQPIERNLKRERLTVEELTEQARQQQIGSLDDVAWAVLETSGEISFVQKGGS